MLLQKYFFILIFNCSLLVYRNFYSNLYPATLLNLLVQADYFCRFYSIFLFYWNGLCSLQIKFYFFFFQSGCYLFSFSCLIKLSRNSRIMLNRSSESDHFSLITSFISTMFLSGMDVRFYKYFQCIY